MNLNNLFSKITILSLVMAQYGCSLLIPDRSFIEEMEREDGAFFRPGQDFPVVTGDSGDVYRSREEIKKRTPLSERNQKKIKEELSLEEELKEKEENLSEYENQNYLEAKEYLLTTSDKLYYLSLTEREKARYISTRKTDLANEVEEKMNMVRRHSIHSKKLVVGMEKSEVIELWGKPAKIEIAGNPKFENERWSFLEGGAVRQIYFEGGRLQGWAIDF